MAQPSTTTNEVRQAMHSLSDSFDNLVTALRRYDDFGADYFNSYLGTDESPATDITPNEFHAAVTVVKGLAAALTSQQRLAIAKMRR